MKRLLLMMAMAMTVMAASSQIILWDGEDKDTNSDGGFWNRADPTVVDDNGNKCLKVTLKANPEGWDKEHCNAALPLGDVDFRNLRRMTMRIAAVNKYYHKQIGGEFLPPICLNLN